ncbi:MAG TPA: hypothetical protein VLD13_06625 [Gaiellaceae bacterium]|nr:hypothetical protein [Gaiellaceae bacterium]
MEQLEQGLWTWAAPHREWCERPLVRFYALERDAALVPIDPVSPPAQLLAGRELQAALTCPWHGRTSPGLGAPSDDYRAWLRPLLEPPVELFLPTRADPGGRELLERAAS